ncbi:hypothetical protein SCHIN_v1c08390 [Spiroplasma chinense]|uniref:Uncharacterized protein n=1 Tax=Spiroplasma chinense TaxID=216932 RepID=A0A5B9Y4M1_9MOLU|nr:hypothetical protein [Spiroplasma chinense]QEH62034.1 hypothetical protein SCHIN_v1c08390 [Spiroplasma chinense]
MKNILYRLTKILGWTFPWSRASYRYWFERALKDHEKSKRSINNNEK